MPSQSKSRKPSDAWEFESLLFLASSFQASRASRPTDVGETQRSEGFARKNNRQSAGGETKKPLKYELKIS